MRKEMYAEIIPMTMKTWIQSFGETFGESFVLQLNQAKSSTVNAITDVVVEFN